MGHRQRMGLIAATMLFVVLLTACGGGGGGSDAGYSNASLNGRYYGGHFNLNSVGTESAFNAMTFDGNGQGAADLDHNRIEGVVGTVFSEHVTGTYSVQSDASVNFVTTVGASTSTTEGMVGAGGNTLILSNLDDTTVHNLSFGFKAGTGHTLAKLQGDYHGVGLTCRRNLVTTSYGPCAWLNERNTIFLDGSGNYSASSWDPAHPAAVNTTGTLSVADDGTGTVTSSGGPGAKKVWFSADGSLLMQVEIADNSQQKLYVGMRKGSGYSNSTLKGTYSFGLFERSASVQSSAVGTLVFDGAGTVTLDGVISDDTSTQQPLKATTSYNVNADGFMTLTVGKGALQGVVSADGGTLAIVPWATTAHGVLVASKQ